MNFHLESFADHVKTVKTMKLFCLETFMVYGMLIFYHMIIYSEIDKYKGVHINTSQLAVTGTLSFVPHQTDNPNYHAHDVEYNVQH